MQRKKLVVELCQVHAFSVGEGKVESDGVFWELERKGVEKEIFGGHKLSYVFKVVYKLCYSAFIV